MSVSYWQDTVGITTEENVDIIIIGAGLAGLSTAYWLNKLDPNLDIKVIDKGKIGCGASGRNAGFITCGSTEHFSRMVSAYGEDRASQIWKFTEYNHKLMVEEFGLDFLSKTCEYKQQGSWTLASTEHEMETIKNSVSYLQKQGVRVEWFNDKYIKERFRPNSLSHACVEGFYGGAHYYADAELHPVKYLWHLALASGTKVSILENREVFELNTDSDKLEIKTNKNRFTAQGIVVCTNAWSGQLFPWFKDKVTAVRGQIIVTEPVAPFLEPCYCSNVLDYFRQLADGRVLIGGFRNADIEKEVGFSDEINPTIHRKLEDFLNKHFPILREKRIDYRWSGVMGFARDGYPMVGALSEDPRIYYNVGFTAHGLGFTFATGELTARLILEGKDPGIFSGRRFK